MSIHAVVDTSVAYKWFYRDDEPGVAEADALLEAHLHGRLMLAAPTTLPVEMANALRYSGRALERVTGIIALLDDAHIQLFHPGTDDLQDAVRLAVEHDISIYDALFLALACKLGCPLVTSDRKAFARPGLPGEIHLI